MSDSSGHLLEVRDLETSFASERGTVRAVRGVSLTLERGKTLGVVGESGSGKSVLSRSIMGLMPGNATRTGAVRFEGNDILDASPKEMRGYWGDQMAMVFQDPMTALNPVLRVEQQITESLHEHIDLTKKQARDTAMQLLESVGSAATRGQVRSPGDDHDLSVAGVSPRSRSCRERDATCRLGQVGVSP